MTDPTEAVDECAAGLCDHYTCTEGASLDSWVEPEPTQWDCDSEAYGPTAKDADDFFASEPDYDDEDVAPGPDDEEPFAVTDAMRDDLGLPF